MRKQRIGGVAAALSLGVLLAGASLQGQGTAPQVKYPAGFRKWTHIKTMVIQSGHPLYASFGGIHHVYANDAALRSTRKGKPYPEGAVLVFDLLEARTENNAVIEGARKVVAVMEKDSKKYPDTGGWGFEGFKGDNHQRVVTDAKKDCFNCHSAQKQTDYVFSQYRR